MNVRYVGERVLWLETWLIRLEDKSYILRHIHFIYCICYTNEWTVILLKVMRTEVIFTTMTYFPVYKNLPCCTLQRKTRILHYVSIQFFMLHTTCLVKLYNPDMWAVTVLGRGLTCTRESPQTALNRTNFEKHSGRVPLLRQCMYQPMDACQITIRRQIAVTYEFVGWYVKYLSRHI